ncbi:MAG: bifunctional oligoribonuclease/PAP phosphatase NrnA [Holophagaceae bacterium]|nr:bifunctional oligoribonuclease/PAP phosphatase NrnA [Holophagaceae bacterium]
MPEKFIEQLKTFDKILLTPHENPDADAIGSALGLAWHLYSLGKEFRIIISPIMPGFLEFLDTRGWIEIYNPDTHKDIASWPECWVMTDASDPDRLGHLKDSFIATAATRAFIDHHLHGGKDCFHFSYLNTEASSTCELVTEALEDYPNMPGAMAQALYAGIVDDTGNFRFSNTTSKVFRMVAGLLESGVEPDTVNRCLYNQGTLARMRLTARVIERMSMYADERLAVLTASLDDLESVGATPDDLEGLVSRPLELRTVEVSALVYEKPDGTIKVSMRSKLEVNVNTICRSFGGGGHRLASGAKFDKPMKEVLDLVIPAMVSAIENYKK